MESRALNALANHFVYLCGVGGDSALAHLSLQFDDAEILTKPFRAGFKATAGSAISEMDVYRGGLVGELHSFPLDEII